MNNFPIASTFVNCSDERHTIRWEAGELLAPDHGDPEAERALAALGGIRCACLDILSAWARHKDDHLLLSAVSRGPGDFLRTEGDMPARGILSSAGRNAMLARRGSVPRQTGWVASAPRGVGVPRSIRQTRHIPDQPEGADEDIALLAALGGDVAIRLAATVTANLIDQLAADGSDASRLRPALEASLYGRVTTSLRSWLKNPELEISLEVVSAGEPEHLEVADDAVIHVALPLGWVSDVWGRDLSVMAGRFSLGLVEATGTRTSLHTIGTELGSPRTLSIELSASSD